MKREDFFFDSNDGISKIHAMRWIPEEKPVCIVQITHGMSEYVERYDDFAKFLCERGILVTGDDHMGHGQSAHDNLYGYFCKGDAASTLVEDEHSLRKLTEEAYPGVPYFVLGHSMGSFIIRNYIFTHGEGLKGAIVMGTGMQPKPVVTALKIVSSLACVFGKNKKPCNGVNNMGFGTYLSKIENPRTSNDWLTKDEKIVDAYNADPLCGFVFTGNGFKTLSELILRLHKKSNLEKMPKAMPVLITSGADDPVGDYGAGPKQVFESYKELGMKDVSIKLYETDRHEILNETDRATVYADLYAWISSKLN